MSKIWLTRTLPAAEESAVAWQAAGFTPLIEPLLDIEPVAHDPLPDDAVVVFTSKNGVAQAKLGGLRVICVGDATAEMARAKGFRDVISVDGTSSDVTDWAVQNLSTTQPIYHLSGWHVRGSIIEDLKALGYSAQRIKTYRSIQRSAWPNESFSYVALYSPLAAKTFAQLAKSRNVSALSAVCISQAAADELSGLELKSIRIANRPREDELILSAKL